MPASGQFQRGTYEHAQLQAEKFRQMVECGRGLTVGARVLRRTAGGAGSKLGASPACTPSTIASTKRPADSASRREHQKAERGPTSLLASAELCASLGRLLSTCDLRPVKAACGSWPERECRGQGCHAGNHCVPILRSCSSAEGRQTATAQTSLAPSLKRQFEPAIVS